MTRLILCFALLFSVATVSAQHKDHAYDINIYQDGKLVQHQLGVYQLEKKPFQIEFRLTNVEGVFVNASYNDAIYKTPHSQPIPGFESLPKMVNAKAKGNKNSEMKVDQDWSYMPYSKENASNFDEVKTVNNQTVLAKKTISQISSNGKVQQISNVNAPIYLFFVALNEHDHTKDLGRIKLKINWK